MKVCRKVKYKTVKEARKHLKILPFELSEYLSPYKCNKCGYYHLGNALGRELRYRKNV